MRALPPIRAGIHAFPGILIEDAWIQRHCIVDFEPSTPTALVVGSALEFEDGPRKLADQGTLGAYCAQLGEILAQERFHLVNGACPGLPDIVMGAFNSSSRSTTSVGLSAYTSPGSHIDPKEFAPDGFPISADTTVFCGTGFELLNVLNTLCADILIVVGGGVGTLLEAATAVEQELTVLCLEPSGGISRELRSLLSKYVADFKNFDVKKCEDLGDIRASLRDFRSKFVKSGRITRLAGLKEDIGKSEVGSKGQVHYEISPDTRSIEYSYGDVSVELHDPVLMTDRVRISRVPTKGEQLLAAIEDRQHAYSFGGVEVVTSRATDAVVWGPNIDTLLMLRVLQHHQERFVDSNALEIGFGSGLISFWLASQKNIASVKGIDIDASSILAAEWNRECLGLVEKCDLSIWNYDGTSLGEYNLVVCNPPYLPFPKNSDINSRAFAGCTLLVQLLENYEDLLTPSGVCFVTASSASFLDDGFSEIYTRLLHQNKLKPVEVARVPLKIHEVLDDADWLEYLAEGNGIFHRPDDAYSWWHDVSVYELCRG